MKIIIPQVDNGDGDIVILGVKRLVEFVKSLCVCVCVCICVTNCTCAFTCLYECGYVVCGM